jgi:hypothetical protein
VIKIRPYEIKEKDIDSGLIDIPKESLSVYYNLFDISHKEVHIIEKIGSFEGFLIVKVMENFIDETLGGKKMQLRTLRIYDLENNYQLLDSILLE